MGETPHQARRLLYGRRRVSGPSPSRPVRGTAARTVALPRDAPRVLLPPPMLRGGLRGGGATGKWREHQMSGTRLCLWWRWRGPYTPARAAAGVHEHGDRGGGGSACVHHRRYPRARTSARVTRDACTHARRGSTPNPSPLFRGVWLSHTQMLGPVPSLSDVGLPHNAGSNLATRTSESHLQARAHVCREGAPAGGRRRIYREDLRVWVERAATAGQCPPGGTHAHRQ